MAYYYASYRKPAALLILVLLLKILLTSEHARAARSLSDEEQRTPLSIKLDLTRLDIPPAGKFSYAHLQHVLHRSSLRVARFHYMLHLNGGAPAALIGSSSTYTTQLNTAPASYKTPVFADSSEAAFLTTLSIGTPPVSFNAIVDTGSDLIWLQCLPCISCFANEGPNTIFEPSLSSSYSKLPCSNDLCTSLPSHECGAKSSCSYTYSYGDNTQSTGDLSLDTITLPDPCGRAQRIAGFAFGCGHNNTYNPGSSEGLLGLALGPLSLPSQLGVSHISYCLQTITDPASKTSPLYLGNAAHTPSSSRNGPTLTTPFFTNPAFPLTIAPFYYVKLNGISVGGQLVTGSSNGAFDIQSDGSGGIIFDSGSTITSLKEDVYNAVVDAFTSAIRLPRASNEDASTLCYDLSCAASMDFPSLIFHFEGADLELPFANVFVSDEETSLICLALGPASMGSSSIFGNIQQQNFFIAYDLQAYTLSLTPTTCDS